MNHNGCIYDEAGEIFPNEGVMPAEAQTGGNRAE